MLAMTEDSSLTQRAYVQLRADLISCRIEPGARLNIARLQQALGLSQAAVREALSRLTSEGLATIERNSGFRAAPVALDGYRELATACVTIELPLLRSAIKNGDLAWEGDLLSCYHIASRVLDKVVKGELPLDDYATHREKFHEKLFSASDNQWLRWCWSLIYAQNVRYRQTFRQLAGFEQGLNVDYRHFVDVVIKRDADEAERIWLDHFEKVTQFIEQSLEPKPRQVA